MAFSGISGDVARTRTRAEPVPLFRANFAFLVLSSLLVFPTCDDELENRAWVFIDPVQCLGSPWERAWLEEHDYDYDSYPESESERLAIFENYYEDKGVEIYDIKHEWVYENVCAACSCPNGDRIHSLIDETDVDQMVSWGFTQE